MVSVWRVLDNNDFEGIFDHRPSFTCATWTCLGDEYQVNMMKCLREVNIDHNVVGWYQSTYMDNFVTFSFLETQFNYQENISQSIVLVYGSPTALIVIFYSFIRFVAFP